MKHVRESGVVGHGIASSAAELGSKLREALSIVDDLAPRQPSSGKAVCPEDETTVRALLRARRHRAKFFREDLFADPAWDMLLELHATDIGQQRISVTSLTVAAAVPPTTALRWIAALEKEGLIRRRADPIDRRRIFVELSEEGSRLMHAYFDSLRSVPLGL